MTPQAFRDALAALGLSQAAFARVLAEHGHPAKDVARSVRRWAEIGPPGEVVVILALQADVVRLRAFARYVADYSNDPAVVREADRVLS